MASTRSLSDVRYWHLADKSEPFQFRHLSRYDPPKWGAAMRRREFITLLGGATAFWPLAAGAQPAGPVRLVGVLMDYAENDRASQSLVAVFRDELAKLGWKEGGNLRIEVFRSKSAESLDEWQPLSRNPTQN